MTEFGFMDEDVGDPGDPEDQPMCAGTLPVDPMSAAFFGQYGDGGPPEELEVVTLADAASLAEAVWNENPNKHNIIRPKVTKDMEPLPKEGYENAVCPDRSAPPKSSTVKVRIMDGSFGNDFTIGRDFESCLRGLLGTMQQVPSIDQLNTLIDAKESARREAYDARERDRQTMDRLEIANSGIERLETSQAEFRSKLRIAKTGQWIAFFVGTIVASLVTAGIATLIH
jgi:hypothetical protein